MKMIKQNTKTKTTKMPKYKKNDDAEIFIQKITGYCQKYGGDCYFNFHTAAFFFIQAFKAIFLNDRN